MSRLLVPSLLVAALGGCLQPPPADGPTPAVPATAWCAEGCPAGHACLSGVCLQLCDVPEDCVSGSCHPFPDATGGWCGQAGEAPAGDAGPLPPKGPPPDAADVPPPAAPEPPADEPVAPPPPSPEPPPADEPAPPASEPEPPAPEPDCVYPGAADFASTGAVMPRVSWTGAHDGDGDPVDLDLRDVYCGRTHRAVVFVVGAQWCSTCPDYIREVGRQAEDIARAGGLLVIVETEDERYRPATHRGTQQYLRGLIGDAPSIRVGDGETRPRTLLVRDSPVVQSYPSAFVVRTSDMRVVVDQHSSASILPFADIVADPDAFGSGGARCGPDDEEPAEPNDTPERAGVLRPGTVSGGICDGAPDFWRIESPGEWRVDLDFRHAHGDLDLFLWDPARRGPAIGANGRPLGSDSADDGESFAHRGPAVIQVYGYQGATASYRITLTER